MLHRLRVNPKLLSLLIDLILIFPLLAFAAWIYLIPPFQTFGYHTLFSDDAIFAMLARQALEVGPQGAYHLSWGPLLPWFIAILNKFFNIPLDEGGRIITGASLTLRVIPIYFLSKIAFNRLAGLIASFFVIIYIFIAIPQEATLAEGLYTLIVFTGFFVSFLALKTEKIIYYVLSGALWGATYLTRFEGWFFLTPLFLITAFKFILGSRSHSIKVFIVLIFSFTLITFPYLSFVRQFYGSWSLNPRVNIVLSAPGNNFALFKDNYGLSTPAQVYFSGDHKYYISDLWHPTLFVFWRSLGRSWATTLPTPIAYYNFFKENSMTLFIFGILGLLITLYTAFRKKSQLFLVVIAGLGLGFALIDFFLNTVEFLSPIIFNPDGNLEAGIKQFQHILSLPEYQRWLIRDTVIVILAIPFIIIKKQHLSNSINHFYVERLRLFLPLSLFLGLVPLFFNSFASKYAVGTGAILAFFAGLSIASGSSWVTTFFRKIFPRLPNLLITVVIPALVLFGVFWINRQQFYRTLDTRKTQYKVQDLQISYLKIPGQVILKDHGPGAKVGVFHEAPVFYAEGRPFYFAVDGNITLEQSLSYLEENQVDYMVINNTQVLSWKQLKPLLSPTTELTHWKMIYSDPLPEKIRYTESGTNTLVAVWKHTD